MNKLASIEALAVSKALPSKILREARGDLEPGEYEVDTTVRVTGKVRVGEDYETTVPNKAKPWNLVTTLLTELNTLREASGMGGIDIDKLVAMAETVDPNLVKESKKKAMETAASLKEATRKTANGKVTTDLTVTAV